MSFCDSRWLTKDAALSRVALEMVFGGCVAETPASSSPITWLKTCRAHAKRGISSGVFDLGGTFPSLIALFTSSTN